MRKSETRAAALMQGIGIGYGFFWFGLIGVLDPHDIIPLWIGGPFVVIFSVIPAFAVGIPILNDGGI